MRTDELLATVAMSGVFGATIDAYLVSNVGPAAIGSITSLLYAIQDGDQKAGDKFDVVLALFSSFVFGLLLGPWMASIMPGDESAAEYGAIFLASFLATNTLRWLRSRRIGLGGITKGSDDDK